MCGLPSLPLISKPQKPQVAIKTSEFIALGGLALVGIWAYRKYSAGVNLVFVPGNVTSASVINTNPSLQFEIIAQNTSSTDLVLNSFAGNLFANNTLVGNVNNFLQTIIPGNSSTPIALTANLLALGLVGDIIQAIQTGNFSQVLELDAKANVNGVQITIPPMKFNIGS